MPFAYQVRRSEFDEILIRNAGRKGANVIEGCRVRRRFPAGRGGARIHAEHEDGRTEAGRRGSSSTPPAATRCSASRFKVKRRNSRHNSAAMYGHFSGARRHPGKDAGNITVFWFDHGWFWFIPLVDGATSVGAVGWPAYMKTRGKRSVEQFFSRHHRAVSVAGRAARGCNAGFGGRSDRQLFLRVHALARLQLSVAGGRLCIHRSDLFVRGDARDEQRLRRRRHGRYLPLQARRSRRRRWPVSTR